MHIRGNTLEANTFCRSFNDWIYTAVQNDRFTEILQQSNKKTKKIHTFPAPSSKPNQYSVSTTRVSPLRRHNYSHPWHVPLISKYQTCTHRWYFEREKNCIKCKILFKNRDLVYVCDAKMYNYLQKSFSGVDGWQFKWWNVWTMHASALHTLSYGTEVKITCLQYLFACSAETLWPKWWPKHIEQ